MITHCSFVPFYINTFKFYIESDRREGNLKLGEVSLRFSKIETIETLLSFINKAP